VRAFNEIIINIYGLGAGTVGDERARYAGVVSGLATFLPIVHPLFPHADSVAEQKASEVHTRSSCVLASFPHLHSQLLSHLGKQDQ
jgi:hypothetical protein